jgi:superoxide dismutase, Cu-Zn family
MKETISRVTSVLLLGLAASVAGCGDDEPPGGAVDGGGGGDGGGSLLASSSGAWSVYDDAFGDAGTANPISKTMIMGKAEAFALPEGKMRMTLTVSGMPASRHFGSHLHKLACDNMKGGAHYQHQPFPDGGSATDPTYANSTNEVWLDFMTDASGAGSANATVNWVPRPGEAKSVIIHDMMTGTGGVAGARLACVGIAF